MVFLGVPIFDWVLLVVVLGLGVEAWMTCRPSKIDAAEAKRKAAQTARADAMTAGDGSNTGEPPVR